MQRASSCMCVHVELGRYVWWRMRERIRILIAQHRTLLLASVGCGLWWESQSSIDGLTNRNGCQLHGWSSVLDSPFRARLSSFSNNVVGEVVGGVLQEEPSGQAIVVVVIYQTSMDAFESQQPVHELQLWEPFCILDFWSSSYQGVAYWYLRWLLDVCLLVGMLVSQLAHTCLMFIWTATWLEPSHLSAVSSMPMTFSVDRGLLTTLGTQSYFESCPALNWSYHLLVTVTTWKNAVKSLAPQRCFFRRTLLPIFKTGLKCWK